MNMPPVTKNIIIINVLFFLGTIVAPKYGINLTEWLGLHFFMASDFKLYQLFTYMFMHGGFEHLFFNMFAVWMFGRILEQVWGPRRFLFYYLLCGVGAGVMQEIVQYIQYATVLSGYDSVNMGGNYIVPMGEYLNMMTTVGASGSIYAILLAFGMTFPNQPIYLYFLLPMKAKYFVIGYAALEVFLGLSQRGDGIAHFAHLGGMLFGFLLIMYWRKKNKHEQTFY
jgi:membrane associated rhomboid family serine protease